MVPPGNRAEQQPDRTAELRPAPVPTQDRLHPVKPAARLRDKAGPVRQDKALAQAPGPPEPRRASRAGLPALGPAHVKLPAGDDLSGFVSVLCDDRRLATSVPDTHT